MTTRSWSSFVNQNKRLEMMTMQTNTQDISGALYRKPIANEKDKKIKVVTPIPIIDRASSVKTNIERKPLAPHTLASVVNKSGKQYDPNSLAHYVQQLTKNIKRQGTVCINNDKNIFRDKFCSSCEKDNWCGMMEFMLNNAIEWDNKYPNDYFGFKFHLKDNLLNIALSSILIGCDVKEGNGIDNCQNVLYYSDSDVTQTKSEKLTVKMMINKYFKAFDAYMNRIALVQTEISSLERTHKDLINQYKNNLEKQKILDQTIKKNTASNDELKQSLKFVTDGLKLLDKQIAETIAKLKEKNDLKRKIFLSLENILKFDFFMSDDDYPPVFNVQSSCTILPVVEHFLFDKQ